MRSMTRVAARRGGPDVSAYAAPARATDLTGLPRTYIDVGSAESFRDEALQYAGRLSAAGVSVDFHMWGGTSHGFDLISAHTPLSRASLATRDEFIRRALADRAAHPCHHTPRCGTVTRPPH
ncbi:alpha/beta hydrolase [Streptomyces fractus]|uniref:alpha/beta hydrolase n=1 Tax=Streptomyces fractus TaxID=641806 RepID=UPI003CFB4E3F